MPAINVILDDDQVNEYLAKHNLIEGFSPLEAILISGSLQSPEVLIVIQHKGERVLTKLKFGMLEVAMSAMRGAIQRAHDLTAAARAKRSGQN